MKGVKVLDFVTRELKGRILAVSSIAALVAAEKAANELGMSTISREAAELAVLLPKAPLEHIREEFGTETADVVEALRPKSPYSTIASEAMVLYGRPETDRFRKDAAIAAIAAEAAVVSEKHREKMLNLLDVVTAAETEPVRMGFIEELRARLRAYRGTDEEVEYKARTRLISISMDVCGSTEAKARMKERAQDNQELAGWYEAFHQEFLLREWRLYEALFRADADEVRWDWKHAFVVKGIGDEIWLLYELGEDDLWRLRSLVAGLLHAALNVAKCPIPDGGEVDGDGQWKARNLPLKFYVDIIDDAFEVSGPRHDFVTGRLPDILGPEDSWAVEDLVELGNRLHAGSLMADGRRLVTAIRSDYIGWEVDRFFRMTKYALPCVVAVGRALFEEVVDVSDDSLDGLEGTGLRKAVVSCPIHQGGDMRFDHTFRYVKEDIGANDLKGVGEGYAVYRVLRVSDMFGLRHTGSDKTIMEETFKVFTPDMEQAVRAAPQM